MDGRDENQSQQANSVRSKLSRAISIKSKGNSIVSYGASKYGSRLGAEFNRDTASSMQRRTNAQANQEKAGAMQRVAV